jgi:hypothetical protein
MQAYGTVSSPPVILEEGTAGTSTIYMNNTSAKVTVQPSWYDPGWGYRKKITVNHTRVQANLTAFPVLIDLASDSDLASHAQSNGNDILFTSSNGVAKLSHDIEKYTSSTGNLVAWVKVPSLSSSVDTDLYMYYGNPTCGSQQDKINVWDTNFKGIWHLKEDPSGTAPQMKDSTSNGNNGTSYGAMTTSDQVTGKINGSLDFDGSNDEIQCGNAASLRITTEVTIEAWVKRPSTGSLYAGIAGKCVAGGGSNYRGYNIQKHDTTNKYRFAIGAGSSLDATCVSDSAYTDTNWHYIVGVRKSGINYLYVDGVQQAATSTQAITDSGANFDIGRQYTDATPRWWNGTIDEVRVSNTGRSASWIATCYNNQNSPSTFYSVEPSWYNPSWDYRKRITVNHARVQGNLIAFPVLISLTSDSDLARCAQSDGDDILFTASDGTTKLSHEIEKYVNSTGELVAWVKSDLSDSTDTDIYMYYGNPSVGSQQNAQNVWDSNFKGVWHLKEYPSGTAPQMKDSTKANNGTSGGTMTSGDQLACKINGGLDFEGTDDNINCGDINAVDGATALTVSAWVKCLALTKDGMVLAKDTFAANSELTFWRDETTATGGRTNTLSAEVGTGSADARYYGSTGLLNDNNWHFVVMTYVGGSATGLRGYVDGAEDTAQSPVSTTSVPALRSTTNPVYIGMSQGGSPYFTGDIDEVRISSIARTATWISTEYNNQNSPSTFYSVGSPSTSPFTYDFVLKVKNNQVADAWKVNLKAYSSSNIARISSTTISFHDGTSSDQIIVSNGIITQPEGALYDLAGSTTIYISMSNVQATTSGTSYIYVYLKVLKPNTSTYSLFIITFEIR